MLKPNYFEVDYNNSSNNNLIRNAVKEPSSILFRRNKNSLAVDPTFRNDLPGHTKSKSFSIDIQRSALTFAQESIQKYNRLKLYANPPNNSNEQETIIQNVDQEEKPGQPLRKSKSKKNIGKQNKRRRRRQTNQDKENCYIQVNQQDQFSQNDFKWQKLTKQQNSEPNKNYDDEICQNYVDTREFVFNSNNKNKLSFDEYQSKICNELPRQDDSMYTTSTASATPLIKNNTKKLQLSQLSPKGNKQKRIVFSRRISCQGQQHMNLQNDIALYQSLANKPQSNRQLSPNDNDNSSEASSNHSSSVYLSQTNDQRRQQVPFNQRFQIQQNESSLRLPKTVQIFKPHDYTKMLNIYKKVTEDQTSRSIEMGNYQSIQVSGNNTVSNFPQCSNQKSTQISQFSWRKTIHTEISSSRISTQNDYKQQSTATANVDKVAILNMIKRQILKSQQNRRYTQRRELKIQQNQLTQGCQQQHQYTLCPPSNFKTNATRNTSLLKMHLDQMQLKKPSRQNYQTPIKRGTDTVTVQDVLKQIQQFNQNQRLVPIKINKQLI